MKAQVVSFRCVLKNQLGQILSTSVNQNVLTVGGVSGIPLQGLTEGIQNIQQGEQRRIFVPAAQAYGFYDLEKVKQVSLDQIGENLKLGESIRMERDSTIYRVIEIDEEFATLDANHPLAGQDLIFEVEAFQVRVATPEEMGDISERPEKISYH